MQFLHLCGANWALRQGLFGGRQGLVQRDDHGFLPEHHGDRLGHAAASLELEVAGRMSDLLSHAGSGLFDHEEASS